MALIGSSMVSTGATLAVGTQVMFDTVNLNSTVVQVEVVRLGLGVAGSSALVPSASASYLDGVGLQVAVVNSTANPIGVSIAAGQSTVTGSGVFHVDDNGASLTIDGNSTAIISTASIVRVDTIAAFPANSSLVVITAAVPQSSVTISTAGLGGSSGNAMFVYTKPFGVVGNSTFANPAAITSTALTALWSSAGSTRFNLTDLSVTNSGSSGTLFRVFDGASNGTLLYQVWCASAGGGAAPVFPLPRRGTSGLAVNCKTLPAVSGGVYVSAGGFRST